MPNVSRRQKKRARRVARSTAARLLTLALCLAITAVGCKTSIFDPSGESLCRRNQPGADPLSSSRENDLAQNVNSTGGCGESPWNPTVAALQASPVGQESVYWSAQRPNGAVLFPKKINGTGPIVVMEPKSIIAQIGTEVVVVASYIGEDNERLRVGEKLEWGLDGAGLFLTTNPRNGCLCTDFANTKKVSDRYLITTTSSRLWRIHRGTTTPTDDISILRGQSWVTVQSYQEGTSSVSALATDIDDWNNRSAGSQIHWIDAAFFYPTSGISPLGEPATLTTSVFRKSSDEPRPGWIVRYEILSGPPAGLGPGLDQTIEIQTDAAGQASTVLTQQQANAGTNKILVQVIRPAAGTLERVVVDEKTISQSWSGSAIFNLKFAGPRTGSPGTRQSYQMDVVNLSPEVQDAVVRMSIPAGTNIAASNPPVSAVENQTAVWVLEGLPAKSTQAIRFDLDVQSSGTLNFDARVDRKSASTLIGSGQPNGIAPPLTTGAPVSNTPAATAPPATTAPPMTDTPRNPPRDPFRVDEGSASTPPALTDPPAAQTGSAAIEFTEAFPETVSVGSEFGCFFRVVPKGNAPEAYISMNLPAGLFYLIKDNKSGKVTDRYEGSGKADQPLDFSRVAYNDVYPARFIAEKAGEQTIEIRVVDEKTKKIIASASKSVRVVAAAEGNGTAAAPKAELKMTIQGENNPNFISGKEVVFTFNIKNLENYQLSGLQLVLTPEFDRKGNPWTFVSSNPAGAAPIASGAYQLSLPEIPAGGELNASLTLRAQDRLEVGKLVGDLLTDSEQKIASVEMTYSVITLQDQELRRPVDNTK